MLAFDLRYNYCALALAIAKRKYTVEGAINYFSPPVRATDKKSETADMLSMRASGMTYQQIGDVFGIKKCAVYNRIRRLQGRI